MTIVNLTPCENGAYANQTKMGTFKYIPEGWAAIPAELEETAAAYLPWITLTLQDGAITAVTENIDGKAAWEALQAELAAQENGGEE